MRLKDRIFDCVPAGHYAMVALLRLVDVVETDQVPTAAVECRAQPRLLVNPGFVERHADTPEKLLMLVMHEVHHALLGHTRTLPVATRADNLVFDAVINAMLSRAFPQPAYTALLRDFYRDDRFPECLLRPPEGWEPEIGKVPAPPALRDDALVPALEVCRALYSTEGATYTDLRRVLTAFVALEEARLGEVTLLGDHDGHRRAGLAAQVFVDAVAGNAREWPMSPGPWQGTTAADLAAGLLRVRREPGARTKLRELIARVAGVSSGSSGPRRATESAVEVQSPMPGFDRRAVVARALGTMPLLYRHEVPNRPPVSIGERVHVYLDVSGSMEGLRDALYGAVLDCAAYVHPQVHLFSTRVAEATLSQLRHGHCSSTGGTDIRCVTHHMAAHHVRRAVVITDGEVGSPDAAGAQVLRHVRLGVAYTGPNAATRDLAAYANESVTVITANR